MIKYKGYTARVEVDFDAKIIYGQVLDLRDVLTFRGRTPEEAELDFHEVIDDYLDYCKEKGREPDRPFSGTFSVRIAPGLHKRIAIRAAGENKSLNQWAAEAFEKYVDGVHDQQPVHFIVLGTHRSVAKETGGQVRKLDAIGELNNKVLSGSTGVNSNASYRNGNGKAH